MKIHVWLLLGLVLIWGIQCDNKKPVGPADEGAISINIEVPQAGGRSVQTPAKATVSQGRLRIGTAPVVHKDTLLQVQGGRLRATIQGIPVGQQTVGLSLLDAAGDSLWNATTTVDVSASETRTATLVMKPVGDKPPTAEIQIEPQNAIGTVRTQFTLTADVLDLHDPTEDLEVQWDFDNDNEFEIAWSTDKEALHVFDQVGNFTVALEVHDSSGLNHSVTQQVQIIELVAQIGDTPEAQDQTSRIVNNSVTLNGSGSRGRDGKALVYHWSQALDFPGAITTSVVGTFSDNNTASARSVAFEPLAGPGLYVFTLQVEDQETGLQSETDTLQINVRSQAPVATIDPPGTLRNGGSLVLQGNVSDPDDDQFTYQWSGERIELLSDPTSATPTFTPDGPGEYSFSFVALDTDPQESEAAEVVIQVEDRLNTVPVAFAGDDVLARIEDGAIALDGTGSNDEDADDLQYQWEIVSGTAGGSLDNAQAATPNFTPETTGIFRISLVVSDGSDQSLADEVLVSVIPRDNKTVQLGGNFIGTAGIEPPVVEQVAGGDEVSMTVFAQELSGVQAIGIIFDFFPLDAFAVESLDFEIPNEPEFGFANLETVIQNSVPGFELLPNQLGVLILASDAGIAWNGNAVLGRLKIRLANTFAATDGATIRVNELLVSDLDNFGTQNGTDDYLAGELNLQMEINGGFSPSNTAPVAVAGDDILVPQNDGEIGLDGTASSDEQGGQLEYSWSLISGPSQLDLLDANSATPRFPSDQAVSGVYRYLLEVSDGEENSAPDEILIWVVEGSGTVTSVGGRFVQEVGLEPSVVEQVGPGAVVWIAFFAFGLDGVEAASITLDVDGLDFISEWDFIPALPGWRSPSFAEVFPAEISTNQIGAWITAPGAPFPQGDATLGWFRITTQTDFTTATPLTLRVNRVSFGDAISYENDNPDEFFSAQLNLETLINPNGGDGGGGDNNAIPVADAGEDREVELGRLVRLDGRASFDPDGEALTYNWEQIDGAAIELGGDETSTPSFTPTQVGAYLFDLSVSDGQANSALDTVRIVIVQPANKEPIANAGPDRTVVVGTQVFLDGSGSSDPDGDPFTFLWWQLEGVDSVSLSDAEIESPFFIPEIVGEYVFQLQVDDGLDTSAEDTVVITVVEETAPLPPTANAGSNRTVEVGERVPLDGTGSSAPNGSTLIYVWSQTLGPGVFVTDNTSPNPRFTPLQAGTYVFELIVGYDPAGVLSEPDITIEIGVKPVQDNLIFSEADEVVVVVEPRIGGVLAEIGGTKLEAFGLTHTDFFDVGPGAEIPVTLRGRGIRRLEFFRIDIEVDPPEAFDLRATTFTMGLEGFVTQELGTVGDNAGFIVAAASEPVTALGIQTFGSFTFVMAEDFTPGSPASIRIKSLGLGDELFQAGDLALGVSINGGDLPPIEPDNQPPVANAGSDINVQVGELVTLDGSDSFDPEGETITFDWNQDDNAPTVNLSDSGMVRPSFTPSQAGEYSFVLVVSDGELASAPARMRVFVTAVAAQALVANAGPDINAQVGDIVGLDGSGSFDPEGGTFSFDWIQADGPADVELSDSVIARPTFTPTEAGEYIFDLIVLNDEFGSAPDSVRVFVTAAAQAPVADAGPQQEVPLFSEITLDGSNSFSPTGQNLSFQWFQDSGPIEVELNGDTTANPTFVAEEPGDYVFQLEVTDEDGNTSPTVAVLILVSSNQPPVANTNGDQTVELGTTVALGAADSFDPEGVGLNYNWFQVSGPEVEVFDLFSALASFLAAQSGTYEFELMVNDGELDSEPVLVTITVLGGGADDPRPIIFSGNGGIHRINADGSNLVTLSSAGDTEPAVSPDGRRIAFTSFRDGHIEPNLGVPAGEIYVMPLTGGQQINLTNSPALDGEPAWGPEEPALGLLTFTSLRLNLLNFLQLDLYIVESDRTITNYTNLETQDRQAAWSPDGFVLLYDSFRSIDNFSPEQWDIHLWDGINFVNLSNSPATDQMPAWAPDQTRIAYVSDRNGANDIFVQDLTGGLLQNISQSAAQDLHPAFSPDGNQIAFISDRDGSWGVYIMDANGGNVRLVINGFEFADSPNWVPLLEGEDLLLGEVDLLLGAVLRSGLKTPTGRRTAA